MAKASSTEKKKPLLKPKHRRNLRKYAKLLHGLGINVSEHIEKLELDEKELKEARKRVGGKGFLKPADRTKLRSVFTKILSIMKQTVKLEETIWGQVAPFVLAAKKRGLLATDLIRIKALREIHNGLYQSAAVNLKAELPVVRRFVLGSIASEHRLIFEKYPAFLRSIERAVSDLVEIELKYENTEHALHTEFAHLNKEVRKILHEDAYFITKDLARVYDMRASIYKWLIAADKEVAPKILHTIEKENENLLASRNYYLINYQEHLKRVSDIYLGTKGGKK